MNTTDQPTICVTDDAGQNADDIGRLLRQLAAGNDHHERMAAALATLLDVPQRVASLMQEGDEDGAQRIANELTPHLRSLLNCMPKAPVETLTVVYQFPMDDGHGNSGWQFRTASHWGSEIQAEIWPTDDGMMALYLPDNMALEAVGVFGSIDEALASRGWRLP